MVRLIRLFKFNYMFGCFKNNKYSELLINCVCPSEVLFNHFIFPNVFISLKTNYKTTRSIFFLYRAFVGLTGRTRQREHWRASITSRRASWHHFQL